MRVFGTEISGNRGKGAELTPRTRFAICSAVNSGETKVKVAEDFGVNRSTVYDTFNHWSTHHHCETEPRSGRPSKLNRRDKRYILQLVRRNPRIGWKALVSDAPGGVSKSTVQRALREFYMRKWKSKKRIKLDKKGAQKRLKFAREWASFDAWEKLIFSDECSVQRKSNSSQAYVFRFDGEGLRRDLVNLQNHGKDISQMVWASIWKSGRSPLVIMERDPLSPNNGYSHRSYLKVLEPGLMPFYEPGQIYQQDNAGIHKTPEVQRWFESHGIWVMDWPPNSPDLNPIEHVWKLLKDKVLELYPELADYGRSKIDWTRFKKALQGAWDALDQEVIDRLIDSMPRRLAAVRKAKGWYTKY